VPVLVLAGGVLLVSATPVGVTWADTAVVFLGVSTISVLRWAASGFLVCERADYSTHRYYAVEELLRVRRLLKM